VTMVWIKMVDSLCENKLRNSCLMAWRYFRHYTKKVGSRIRTRFTQDSFHSENRGPPNKLDAESKMYPVHPDDKLPTKMDTEYGIITLKNR
jgi:hypothetical protein